MDCRRRFDGRRGGLVARKIRWALLPPGRRGALRLRRDSFFDSMGKSKQYRRRNAAQSLLRKLRKKVKRTRKVIRDPTRGIKKKLQGTSDYVSTKVKQIKEKGPLYFLSFRPKLVQVLLQKYGDNRVVSVRVGRNPITPAFTKLAKAVLNADKVMSQYKYDQLFHLFMMFTLDNGKTYRFEKNATVNVGTVPTEIHSQIGPFQVKNPIPVREWITKAENTYGSKDDFYKYSFHVHNCQKFVRHLLRALDINSPEIDKFVVQHTESIGSENEQEIVRYLTNIAATYDSVSSAVNSSVGGIESLKDRL